MKLSIRSTIPRRFTFATFALIAFNLFAFGQRSHAASETPRLFILKPTDLIESKRRIETNDSALLPAFNRLRRDADRALKSETFSVTHKEMAPPSGDKHDYMSIAPYWWPNPKTSNGLPYVRRDGEVNPERDQTSDRKRLYNFVQSVNTLALAYNLTGREDYAAHATRLLQVWFVDDATKMNPHLRYAQAIPGRSQGRGAGIIETHNISELIDAVGLLEGSKSWTPSDQKSLQDWFNAYLNWLLESAEGKTEATTQNNHGTWYDVQVASFARFAGRDQLTIQVLTEFSTKRIARQIEPDGRQPHELERTLAWSYSIFNLEAMFSAAAIADNLAIDLWNYESPDKRGIRNAIAWLVSFATGEKKWPYQQLSGLQPEKLAPLLRHAALRYREPAYEKAIFKLPKITGDERWQLLHPKTPEPKQ
jgi:hypothetical protein